MHAFTLAELLDTQRAGTESWVEFLSVPDLTLGLYVLEAGAIDPQEPHTEDEVYVILAGRSRFTAGDETRDVGPGDTIYVPAGTSHRYHDIAETLKIIYTFAPQEGTRTG
jgi:mannose-6-phosphate isomerase-like protein (cupin superfamily)